MGSRKGCGPDATEPQTAAQNGRGGREGGPQPRSPPQSRPAAPRGTAERGHGRGDRDVQKVNPRPPAGFPPSPMGPWRSSPLTGGAQKPSISSVFTPFGRNPGHLATSQIRTRRLGHLASLQTWPPHKCVSGPHTLSYTNLTQQTDTCSTQSVQIWLFYSKVSKWVRGQRNAPGHAAVPSPVAWLSEALEKEFAVITRGQSSRPSLTIERLGALDKSPPCSWSRGGIC